MLYLVVGKSGSGKSTIIDKYCDIYGTTSVKSYTTRKIRKNKKDDENSHIFITTEEFNKIREDLVAYTLFDENEYGATNEQCKNADFYIIDWDGVKYFEQKCTIPFKIIYIMADANIRYKRMLLRGDTKEQASKRIIHDELKFDGVTLSNIEYMILNNDEIDKTILSLRDIFLSNY